MKRLLVLSGKGGTGKTTTAAALIRFANARAIADCDVDAPNLHLVAESFGESSFSDFLGGDKAEIDTKKCISCGMCKEGCRFDAISLLEGGYAVNEFSCEGCGLCAYVCPEGAITLKTDIAGRKELSTTGGVFSGATLRMGRGSSGKLVTEVKLAMLENAGDAPLAIVDGSPGIGCPVIASIGGMDMVLIVAEPGKSGISDMKRLVQTARSFDTRLCICINKWDICPEATEEICSFCEKEGIPLVGKIPYDKSASAAINSGKSLADIDCPARDALFELYQKILILLKNI